MMSKTRKAFSLLEILVGVTIVLLLSMVVLGVSARSVRMAEARKCAANVRAAGLGLLAFAGEQNNQIVVFAGGGYDYKDYKQWAREVYERGYVDERDLFRCPSGEWTIEITHGSWSWETYAINMLMPPGEYLRFPWGSSTFRVFKLNLANVQSISNHILIGDSAASASNKKQTFRIDDYGKGGWHLAHDGKANMFFLDGRLERMARHEIEREVRLAKHTPPTWEYVLD